MCQFLALAILMAAADDSISAGSLIQRLPEDGAWVAFHSTEDWDNGTKRTTKVIVKSVGKTTADNLPCRWIELEFHPELPADKNYALKLLIPESQFLDGGDPLAHVKDAWEVVDGEEPRELPIEDIQSNRPRLDIWLPPLVKNLERSEERHQVEWQQGRLDCEVWKGSQKFKYGYGRVDANYRLSLSDKVPFGIAATTSKLSERYDSGDEDEAKGTIQFSMTDMGRDAVSMIKQAP